MKLTHLAHVFTFILCGCATSFADEFDVYFLGGQSNMEGFGTVTELPENLAGSLDDVFIFHSTPSKDQTPVNGNGRWTPFRPGHGTGFEFINGQNRYSDRFGLEVSLAHQLRASSNGRKIAIIKYARNGSSIAIDAASHWGCWDPDFHAAKGANRDVNQYDHFLATIRNAFKDQDVDGDGIEDQLVPKGIAWMQGESDGAHGIDAAQSYQSNLKRLMDLIRAALRTDDLPVVIGRISDSGQNASGRLWKHGDVVRAAQEAFAADDVAAEVVTSTDQYNYSDPAHYDSAGYIDLGRQFASAFSKLSRD